MSHMTGENRNESAAQDQAPFHVWCYQPVSFAGLRKRFSWTLVPDFFYPADFTFVLSPKLKELADFIRLSKENC